MKKFFVFLFLLMQTPALIRDSYADEVGNPCDKDEDYYSCAVLNYTFSTANKEAFLADAENHPHGVCSECPVDATYYSCTDRAKTEDPSKIQTANKPSQTHTPTCANITGINCAALGYYFAENDVYNVPATYSCSACPLDGTKWACANTSGLVKPKQP
ncbi:MAG: hypothetical protein IKO06_04125 [Alphaproteobacteria bacterium]|nr:hypothetical protein [Alphaproteobacteria bacterium]